MQASSAQPGDPLGQCLLPSQCRGDPLCLRLPQDAMHIVSAELESKSDDLRSGEKEDIDLGEV